MKNLRSIKQNLYQRITAEDVLTRIGLLDRQNMRSILRSIVSGQNALVKGGDLTITTGWNFTLAGESFWVQRKDSDDIFIISQKDPQSLSVSPAHASLDRFDLVQARYSLVDDNFQSVDIIDPLTGTITQQNFYVDKKINLQVQVVTGTPGSGVSPVPTSATSAQVVGTQTFVSTRDLSTKYNLKISSYRSAVPGFQ